MQIVIRNPAPTAPLRRPYSLGVPLVAAAARVLAVTKAAYGLS